MRRGEDRAGTVALSRTPDPRFTLHALQPRGKYLGRKQLQLCRADPAFMQALKHRVSSQARWAAFMQGSAQYTGRPCERCRSTRRRVHNGACYDCMLNRNKIDFNLILQGISPPANRTRDGWLDIQERKRREQAGECMRYTSGPYTAEQFPTGRVRVYAPVLAFEANDLQADVAATGLHDRALQDPDFLKLLRMLGWVRGYSRDVGEQPPQVEECQPADSLGVSAQKQPELITHMEVRPDPAVINGHALSGPVQVLVVRRNGARYTRPLCTLDRDEMEALICRYWEDVPPCIRVLGDTPAAAHAAYIRAKNRGYLRG